MTLTADILLEGALAPTFETETSTGKKIKIGKEQSNTFLLYFYPKDNTPGCTQESCEFGEQHPHFEKLNVTVLGISRDTNTSHEKFKAKYNLPFELIADPDETLCNLFGVMVDKNMYGKKVRGIERSTFLIDSHGVIQKIWRKVKVDGHVDDVLKYISL